MLKIYLFALLFLCSHHLKKKTNSHLYKMRTAKYCISFDIFTYIHNEIIVFFLFWALFVCVSTMLLGSNCYCFTNKRIFLFCILSSLTTKFWELFFCVYFYSMRFDYFLEDIFLYTPTQDLL